MTTDTEGRAARGTGGTLDPLEGSLIDLCDLEPVKGQLRRSSRASGQRPPLPDETQPAQLMRHVVGIAGDQGLTRRALVMVFHFLDQECLQRGVRSMLDEGDVVEATEYRPGPSGHLVPMTVYRLH